MIFDNVMDYKEFKSSKQTTSEIPLHIFVFIFNNRSTLIKSVEHHQHHHQLEYGLNLPASVNKNKSVAHKLLC